MSESDHSSTTEQYLIFAYLWVFAHLVHTLQDLREVFWTDTMLVVVCFALLILPKSGAVFLAMCLVQIANAIQHLPHISNHWMLTAFINVTIVVSFLIERSRQPERALHRAIPAIRSQVILVYFFAVFHKLNTDFFAIETSCASLFYREQTQTVPLLPESVTLEGANIWLTLGIESLIPILLIIPRLRVPGLALAASFHYLVAANPHSHYYNFSAVLFALFFLFTPENFQYTWRYKFHPLIQAFNRKTNTGRLNQFICLTGFLIATGLGSLYSNPQLFQSTVWGIPEILSLMTYFCYAGVLWTWVIVGTLVLAIFVLAVGGERWIGTPKRRLRHPALVAIVVLFTVNGASPYLGLKSETSLTMYSNLRTEGDLSNHLFAPEIMRVAPYMDTLVYIEESDHPVLKTYVGTSYGLVDLMFTDIVQQPIARTVYRRNGKRFVIEKAADIPEQYPWILRKVLGFRPVDSGPVKCSH